MLRHTALLAAGALLAAACGSPGVISKEEMLAKAKARSEAAARAKQQQQQKKVEWTGPVATLGEETRLFGTKMVRLGDSDVFLQLAKTTWTSMETPSGKQSRMGTARLLLTRADETKTVQLDEGDQGTGFGFRFDLTHAHEAWDDREARYLPEAKVVVTTAQ